MSTYTTRIFVPSQGTKIGTVRAARMIVDDIRSTGNIAAWRVRPTSQHGRVCITVHSDYAGQHRRAIAFVRLRIPAGWFRDAESNEVAARALAQGGR